MCLQGTCITFGSDDLRDPLALQVASTDVSYLLPLFHMWGTQNDERTGVYSANVTVAGVSGLLFKCEFLDVHTYLTFVPHDATVFGEESLIIDASFRQV